MDTRIQQIIGLLTSYSLGNFDSQIEAGPNGDEIDAIIEGINMLGEELQTRYYFQDLFNSVSEMVFVLSPQGWITDSNRAVFEQLGYEKDDLLGRHFHEFQPRHKQLSFDLIQLELESGPIFCQDAVILAAFKTEIPVSLSISPINARSEHLGGILITARDKRSQIDAENRVLRAVIETEENVRYQLAKDFHDSLGQQLTAMHFYLTTMADQVIDPTQKEMLRKYNVSLLNILSEMRQICFNLAPSTLEEEGLIPALHELCNQTLNPLDIQFAIHAPDNFPLMPAMMERNVYRVAQEFIGNAIHHGRAHSIFITFTLDITDIGITLRDDGIGFDISHPVRKGMGLQNVRSRIQSHGGELLVESFPQQGTCFNIKIPLPLTSNG